MCYCYHCRHRQSNKSIPTSSTATRHLKHSRVYHRFHSTGSVTFRSTDYFIQFNCAHQPNRTKTFRFPTKHSTLKRNFPYKSHQNYIRVFSSFVRNWSKCPVCNRFISEELHLVLWSCKLIFFYFIFYRFWKYQRFSHKSTSFEKRFDFCFGFLFYDFQRNYVNGEFLSSLKRKTAWSEFDHFVVRTIVIFRVRRIYAMQCEKLMHALRAFYTHPYLFHHVLCVNYLHYSLLTSAFFRTTLNNLCQWWMGASLCICNFSLQIARSIMNIWEISIKNVIEF